MILKFTIHLPGGICAAPSGLQAPVFLSPILTHFSTGRAGFSTVH